MLAFQWVCLKQVGYLFTRMHVHWSMYIQYLGFGLLEAPPEHVLYGPFLGIYWLRLCPRFGAPMLEVTLLWRRLFIVLMTAAHISPNVFSLQLSLASVYWTSYYNIQQCKHTYYTSHSHNLILYYIILHDTLMSILHLHFFCSPWQAGCSQLIVSDTVRTPRTSLANHPTKLQSKDNLQATCIE